MGARKSEEMGETAGFKFAGHRRRKECFCWRALLIFRRTPLLLRAKRHLQFALQFLSF